MTIADVFNRADDWLLDRIQMFDPRDRLASLTLSAGAQLLVKIREARSSLAIAERDVQAWVAEQMDAKRVEVPGVGVLERHRPGSRKGWDHDGVRRNVVSRLGDDLPFAGAVDDNGERVPLAAVVDAVVTAWTQACGYQWKVTGLRALGIDPDEFSQYTPDEAKAYSVEVH